MTSKAKSSGAPAASRRIITLERTYHASLDDVWKLWTTREGLESWWGPDGFAVAVRKFDLRAGGELHYDMFPTQPDKVAFMKQAGMALVTQARITFSEVVARRRLAYTHLADFIPGVEPYDVATTVELHKVPKGVRLVMTFEAMHDDVWTQRAVAGWENELDKLAKALAV